MRIAPQQIQGILGDAYAGMQCRTPLSPTHVQQCTLPVRVEWVSWGHPWAGEEGVAKMVAGSASLSFAQPQGITPTPRRRWRRQLRA